MAPEETFETALDRPLPAALDSEKLCIGAALNEPDAWPILAELLTVSDFSSDRHKRLFRQMEELFEAGRQLNLNSVANELGSALPAAGGLSYLIELTDIPKLENLDHYCQAVKKAAIRREVILHSTALIDRCYEGDDDAYEETERIREAFLKASKRVAARTLEELIADDGGINAFMAPQANTGIRIPFEKIHVTLDGLRKQCFTILGARPAVGKTALAFQIAESASLSGNNVLFVSLEMGARRLVHRAITSRALVSSYKFRNGYMNPEEKEAVRDALTHLGQFGSRMLYADDSGMTVQGLEALLRTMKARGKAIDLVVVDYLQLMGTVGHYENRVQEVSVISRSLKKITMRYDIPVLALSQLARKDGRITAEPELDWLKESGQIEQDADHVLFLWPGSENLDEDIRKVKWKVAKNRDGALSYGDLDFQARYCRFLNQDAKESAA